MSKLLKTVFLFSLVLFLFSAFAFAEEITITTYYPSPYGSYNALGVDKLGVGDNDASGTFTSADVPSTTGNVWIKGNVGIGTMSPAGKLEIVKDTTTITDEAAYALRLISDATIGMLLGTSTTTGTGIIQTLDPATSWTKNLSINPNGGNVGIRNTNPGALLDIGTAGSILGTLRLEGNTSGYVQIQPLAAAGSWTLTLPPDDGTNTYQLTTNGSGVTTWTGSSSVRSMKNIVGTAQPSDALTKILNTKVYRFHYKPGMATGDSDTEYVGVMADEAPWAMHHNNSIVNPVNTLGYMVLGIQALNAKITSLQNEIGNLKAEINKLKANPVK